jgi:hypothetical protein
LEETAGHQEVLGNTKGQLLVLATHQEQVLRQLTTAVLRALVVVVMMMMMVMSGQTAGVVEL